MKVIRAGLFLFLCVMVNFNSNSLNNGSEHISATIGYSLLESIICGLAYLYGKWFAFVYTNSKKSTLFSNCAEYLFLPLLSMTLLSTTTLSDLALSPDNLFMLAFGALLMREGSSGIREWLWQYRMYEYKDMPDNGVVPEGMLNKQFTKVVVLLIGLSVAAGVFRVG